MNEPQTKVMQTNLRLPTECILHVDERRLRIRRHTGRYVSRSAYLAEIIRRDMTARESRP